VRKQATLYYLGNRRSTIWFKVVLLDGQTFEVNLDDDKTAETLNDLDEAVNFGCNDEGTLGVPITFELEGERPSYKSARIDKSRLTEEHGVDWDYYRDYVDLNETEGQHWDERSAPGDDAFA